MISLRKVALNCTIFSACAGVGATSHAHVSVVFFCTPVISSSCPLLKLSSRTSLKSPYPVTFAREGLLIFTDSILFLAMVL